MLDIPNLLGLAHSYVEEVAATGVFVPQFDAEYACSNMMNTIQSETGLAIVCIHGGKLIAVLWAFVVEPVPWSHHRAADCQMFYVSPSHRGGRHAFSLMKAFKVWADMMDCTEVRISTASGVNTKRVERMFSHLGFTPLGTTYHIKKEI